MKAEGREPERERPKFQPGRQDDGWSQDGGTGRDTGGRDWVRGTGTKMQAPLGRGGEAQAWATISSEKWRGLTNGRPSVTAGR